MEDKNIEYVLPVERDDLKPKINKRLIIIISVAAFLLFCGVVVLISFLVPKSVKGSWELVVNPEIAQATADQIEDADRVYYVFGKPNQYGQGEWKTLFDGGVEHYEYKLSEKDGVKKINLGSADLEYKITGSKLLGTAKMTIILPQYTDELTGQVHKAQEYVFKQRRAPDYTKESYDDFETDSKLLGEWATNERTLSYYYYELSYEETVSFNDNGVMVIRYESEDLALDRYMYYSYTVKDNKITFSLVTDKETKYTVGYEFDKDNNLKFVDDTTSSSIFADAFFGDFTYYTPENLPKPSVATADESVIQE